MHCNSWLCFWYYLQLFSFLRNNNCYCVDKGQDMRDYCVPGGGGGAGPYSCDMRDYCVPGGGGGQRAPTPVIWEIIVSQVEVEDAGLYSCDMRDYCVPGRGGGRGPLLLWYERLLCPRWRWRTRAPTPAPFRLMTTSSSLASSTTWQ